MTMKEQLLEEIRGVRKYYLEVEKIIPFEKLCRENVAIHPRSSELLSCLKRILRGTQKIESGLSDLVLQNKKSILLLPDEDKRLIDSVVRPRYERIRELFINYHPDGWIEDLFSDLEPGDGTESTEIAHTVRAALEFYDERVEEGDERREDEFHFDGAFEVIESAYFVPDQWRANARALQPVVQSEPPHDAIVPVDVRRRVDAAYSSFLFGNWFACIAMARTALEYALRSKTRTWMKDRKLPNQPETFSGLDEMIRFVAEQGFSRLLEPMERIRTRGNAVLHPGRKHDRLANPRRKESLEVVGNLKLCIEVLFAK